MNPFLEKFCAGRGLEYLKVDDHWRIQEISDDLQRFESAPETLGIGKDIREFLPELLEWEEFLNAVLLGDIPHFHLNQIDRLAPKQPPVYFDLWANRIS